MSGLSSHPILAAMATGDALGLPYEGTIPTSFSWGFVGGRGMTSDDTQFATLTLGALRDSGGNQEKFRRMLADRLVHWFCCLPPGIGLATAKSCFKLMGGLIAPQSGVQSSGNGPLPRAAILGWELASDVFLDDFVDISTKTTHLGKEVQIAARALARTMSVLKKDPSCSREGLFLIWRGISDDPSWGVLLEHVDRSRSMRELHAVTGQKHGTGGFAFHTLAVAFWLFLIHRNDLEGALCEGVLGGGDTDSVCSVTGALCAAVGGKIPDKWTGFVDWPVLSEPSWKRPIYNLVELAAILFYHIPIRVGRRITGLLGRSRK